MSNVADFQDGITDIVWRYLPKQAGTTTTLKELRRCTKIGGDSLREILHDLLLDGRISYQPGAGDEMIITLNQTLTPEQFYCPSGDTIASGQKVLRDYHFDAEKCIISVDTHGKLFISEPGYSYTHICGADRWRRIS